jgi:hypothetical protein
VAAATAAAPSATTAAVAASAARAGFGHERSYRKKKDCDNCDAGPQHGAPPIV